MEGNTGDEMIKLFNTLIIFFELWGSYHYENRIGAALAWELATIFEEHSDALEGFGQVTK